MNHIEQILEKVYENSSIDSSALSTYLTKTPKSFFLMKVDDVDLVGVASETLDATNKVLLQRHYPYGAVSKHFRKSGRSLLGLLGVKDSKVAFFWSSSSKNSLLLVALGLRIWGELEASKIFSPSLLSVLSKIDPGASDVIKCPPGALETPWDDEVYQVEDEQEDDFYGSLIRFKDIKDQEAARSVALMTHLKENFTGINSNTHVSLIESSRRSWDDRSASIENLKNRSNKP